MPPTTSTYDAFLMAPEEGLIGETLPVGVKVVALYPLITRFILTCLVFLLFIFCMPANNFSMVNSIFVQDKRVAEVRIHPKEEEEKEPK